MNYKRIIGLALGLAIAGQTMAQVSISETALESGEANNPEPGLKGNQESRTAQLREWLKQRKQARKQGGAELRESDASHLAYHPPVRREFGHTREESEPRTILHIGRGADGRIHHRYVFNDEGPDELQVYSGSGYTPAETSEDAGKPAGERTTAHNPSRRTRIAGLSTQASLHYRRR